MKKIYGLIILGALKVAFATTPAFDELMHIGDPGQLISFENKNFYGTDGLTMLRNFKQLYQEKITQLNQQNTYRIPKKIHQIWLGSEYPERYKAWQAQIKQLHPDWEYKLWTEKEIDAFKLVNKKLYNKARNYGEKSDIARIEILYREGGVYLDCDAPCLRSIDELHQSFDFYAGLEPFWAGSESRCLSIGNTIIGSIPGHPILKQCMKNIRKLSRKRFHLSYRIETVAKTGPMMFTLSCYQILFGAAPHTLESIILPSKLVYPESSNVVTNTIRPYFFHAWDNSWLPKK